MRVGIVSLWWSPVNGGAEIYAARLADLLAHQGVGVTAATAYSRGAERASERHAVAVFSTGELGEPGDLSSMQTFYKKQYRAWTEKILNWSDESQLTHVLLNDHRYPTLAAQLKRRGIKVGLISHDYFPAGLVTNLLKIYWHTGGSWEQAISTVSESERAGTTRYYEESSIWNEEWDFIIWNTQVAAGLANPAYSLPRFVLHPPVPADCNVTSEILTPRVTIGALNPLIKKGAVELAGMISGGPAEWTFRILQGGWGEAWRVFLPMISAAMAIEGRVNLENSVSRIGNFLSAAEVFVCASRVEGYGMAPVEALYCGTPVVATDLPTIREGLGDAGVYVPYFAHAGTWVDTVSGVLADRKRWVEAAAQRSHALRQRQDSEVKGLISFLSAI